MSLRSASARHTRPKKLGPKQNVQIFREDEVDQLEFDSNRGASQIETGVEKGEEQVSRDPQSWPVRRRDICSY